MPYLTTLCPSKRDRLREDWLIVQSYFHDRLELPTGASTGMHDLWEKVPDLQREYNPMLKRIKFLVGKGLISMMVLSDFLSQCIAPLQQRAHTTWLYTGENDTTWLERGHGTKLDQKVLEAMLMKLSSDPHSDDFINLPPLCQPIFLDQAARSLLLKQMPTLNEIDIAVRHADDTSRGVQIPGTDAAGGQRSADTTLGSDKGKGKIAPSRFAFKAGSRSSSSDIEASSEETAPLKRKRRLVRGDASSVLEPASQGQQASM
jgi:hypothetical protein